MIKVLKHVVQLAFTGGCKKMFILCNWSVVGAKKWNGKLKIQID